MSNPSNQTHNELTIGSVKIGEGNPLAIIAGPCVMESERLLSETAEKLVSYCGELGLGLIFKSSYDKANRTAASGYRGPGLEQGLSWLKQVGKDFSVPVTTDVHSPEEAKRAAEFVDLLQIPAFLCRQTDLLEAAAGTGRPINIKKGQFMSAEAMAGAVDKVKEGGGSQILLTERGTMFGYGDLIVDFRSLQTMRALGCAVCFDGTHSLQKPPSGSSAGSSGGRREFSGVLIRSAVAAGVDSLFLECHPDPSAALSDKETQIPLSDLKDLLGRAKEIHTLISSWK